uniref:Death domain-containing protein n=1 Tax=Amphimedon queenslandica TaxID=400682 RepID=A0A1X7TUE4_AMPQE
TDLVEVLDLLRSNGYSGVSYYNLGLYLGLNSATLDVITKNNKGDVESCLRECLTKWLLKADDVQKTKGGSTIYSLVAALRKLGENGVADGIDMEKHPACKILAHCSDQQSSLASALPQLVRDLRTAKLIKEKTSSTDIQGHALLTEIKEAVCNDYQKLEALAEILLKNRLTAETGTVIIKEYREVYCCNELRYTDSICPKFDFPPPMAKVLKLLRFKRSNMFRNVGSIIANKCDPDSTVNDIRGILRFNSSTFQQQLAQCRNEAKEVVRDYNEAVEELNKNQSLEEILSNVSPLQCETITILVDKKDAELILDDVTIYLRNLFLKFSPHIRVYANDADNSVNIACSFPLILSEQLITTALNDIDVLKENKVKRLTIGYCTVYEANRLFYELIFIINNRSGLLKQLMLSLSVQLINSKEEVDTLNEEIMKMKKEEKFLKEEAESLKKTLDTKNKILSASIAESHRFKRIAAETKQLLHEKESHLTEREEENEKLKIRNEILEEQLALFQAEKKGGHNERIEQYAEVSHQHVNEIKSNQEIELLQEKITIMSLQQIEKEKKMQEKENLLKLTIDSLTRKFEQSQNSLKQAESRENTLQEKISQMSQENEARMQGIST